MNEQYRMDPQPWCVSRSTLLVPDSIFSQYFGSAPHRQVAGLSIKLYLARLLDDPLLHRKLGFLDSGKWKKRYQEEGQSLRRVNFYPDDRDWGRLSAISNATGFSRCFIFVYLMLIDLGVLRLEDSGTNPSSLGDGCNPVVICNIAVHVFRRRIERVLQT